MSLSTPHGGCPAPPPGCRTPKQTRHRLNNRLVTFLLPSDLARFRELAYQRNTHTAELLRCAVRAYLQNSK